MPAGPWTRIRGAVRSSCGSRAVGSDQVPGFFLARCRLTWSNGRHAATITYSIPRAIPTSRRCGVRPGFGFFPCSLQAPLGSDLISSFQNLKLGLTPASLKLGLTPASLGLTPASLSFQNLKLGLTPASLPPRALKLGPDPQRASEFPLQLEIRSDPRELGLTPASCDPRELNPKLGLTPASWSDPRELDPRDPRELMTPAS